MNEIDRHKPRGGAYVLLIHLAKGQDIRVGSLGTIHFNAGGYAYVGSAMNGIHQRVQRHLREDTRTHWHIDYLLEKARIVDVVTNPSEKRAECAIARQMSNRLASVSGFGSSDCSCSSHLFYNPDITQLREHVDAAVSAAAHD